MSVSIKQNIVANYAGQFYAILVAIVMVPTYLRYMGAEAYGLIAFFGMMQGWLQLIDIGLTATLSRQVASCRAGGLSLERLNELFRSLVALFVCLGGLVAGFMWFVSDWLAHSWLQANNLPPNIIAHCISLMGVAAALRWVAGLFRGVISGWEKQVLLGGYNIIVATIRFVGVLPVFIWVGTDPATFFSYQLIVAFAELIVLWWMAGTLLPGARTWPCFKLEPLKAMWQFSGALAFCSIVWVFITQTDKLILSKTLPLVNYGHFALAMLIAGGVSIMANPISGALLPRFTFLCTQGNHEALHDLYCNATQWVSIIVWPAASIAAFSAGPLLYAWTGNPDVAKHAAPILFWYALGNACLGVAAFQFYLQFAHGKLRLHMIGNFVFIVVLIPSIYWASTYYGAVGAGRVWFFENLFFLFGWTWIVHRRFAPGLHLRWLTRDVIPIAVVAIGVSGALSNLMPLSTSRFSLGVQLVFMGALSLAATLFTSSSVRVKIFSKRDS